MKRASGIVVVVLTACGFAAPATLRAQIAFGLTSRLASGDDPFALESHDFNVDGVQDLAFLNRGSGEVSIVLGIGLGALRPAQSFPVGILPYAQTWEDFNEDGVPDLLVCSLGADGVLFFVGDGTGALLRPTQIVSIEDPTSIEPGDFNADGHVDFALTSSNFLSIYHGDGAGSVELVSRYEDNTYSVHNVVAEDFDEDGDLDLLVGRYGSFAGGRVKIFPGDVTGTFPLSYEAPIRSGRLALGDFNDDGYVDVVTKPAIDLFCTDGVYVSMGDGSGGFSDGTLISTPCTPNGFQVADFDSNGNLDLAITFIGSDFVGILLGTGTGAFSLPVQVFSDFRTDSPLAMDVDDDGHVDLLVAADKAVYGLVNQADNPFRRGDADANGTINPFADAIFILNFGFVPGSQVPPCLDAADADDNGETRPLLDALFMLHFVFMLGSPPPPPPFPNCGGDPTLDSISCHRYSCP